MDYAAVGFHLMNKNYYFNIMYILSIMNNSIYNYINYSTNYNHARNRPLKYVAKIV